MFAFLKGQICDIEGNLVEIDVGGVGYLALMDAKSIMELPEVGSVAKVLIKPITNDEGTTLYGFTTSNARLWFCELIKISGISGKTAIAILSTIGCDGIMIAVQQKDAKMFTSVSGIGAKLATRIINEIKDISSAIATEEIINLSKTNSLCNDAISALVNLGVQKQIATKAVKLVFEEEKNISLEDLIKKSILLSGKLSI